MFDGPEEDDEDDEWDDSFDADVEVCGDPVGVINEIAETVNGEVRTNYSGRGMFGATCYGIVCANTLYCIEEAASRGIKGARTDNMGKQYIVYWPHIK